MQISIPSRMNTFLKVLFTTSFVLAFTTTLSAQKDKIDWKDDIVTVNGTPVAKIIRKLKTHGYEFSVSGLSGPELIYIKAFENGTYYNNAAHKYQTRISHEVNFIESGSKATLDYRGVDYWSRVIVENRLIQGNSLDPDAERRFIQLNNGYTPSNEVPVQSTVPTVVVNVNNGAATTNEASKSPAKSNSPIVLEGKNILRDGNVIGKFRDEIPTSSYSVKTRVVTVYNDVGEKIAEATAPAEQAEEWKIKILADGKEMGLLYDAPSELENLFKWMASKGYLGN
ncbi:MAG: hypothetical protein RLZZ519_2524 [Bacteroidota bacterium]|jgi:hypothetical protein